MQLNLLCSNNFVVFVIFFQRVEDNWSRGSYHLTRIPCRSDVTKGVYCLQYDKEKIVSGLRDDTIKVWRRFDQQNCQSSRHQRSAQSSSQRPILVPPEPAAVLPNNDADPGSDEIPRPAGDNEEVHAAPEAGDAPAPDGFSIDAGSDGYHCTQVERSAHQLNCFLFLFSSIFYDFVCKFYAMETVAKKATRKKEEKGGMHDTT